MDPRALLDNLILLQRYANGISADAAVQVRALFDELVGIIAKYNPTDVIPRYRQERVEKIMRDVRKLVGDSFDDVFKQARQSIAEVGKQQAHWTTRTLQKAVGVGVDIRPNQMGINLFKTILDRDPFMGLVLGDWAEAQKQTTVRAVRRQVQIGMLNNEPIDDIVRRVRGRSVGRGRYVGGVMETTTREAEAVVRTAVNHISNTAQIRTYKQNADVVTKVEFLATLDRKTSDVCILNDGKVWDIDNPEIPRPPLHFNCRSVLIPVVDWKSLGIDPPEDGTRASMNGQVPASLNYEQWLKDQPLDVQVDVLGKAKAARFRAGESLSRIIKGDSSVVRVAA